MMRVHWMIEKSCNKVGVFFRLKNEWFAEYIHDPGSPCSEHDF